MPNRDPELNAVEHFEAVTERQTDRSKDTAKEILNLEAERIREKLIDTNRKEENEYKVIEQRVKLGVINEIKALEEKEGIRKKYEIERSALQRSLDTEVGLAGLRLGQDSFAEKMRSGERELNYNSQKPDKGFKDVMDFVSGK